MRILDDCFEITTQPVLIKATCVVPLGPVCKENISASLLRETVLLHNRSLPFRTQPVVACRLEWVKLCPPDIWFQTQHKSMLQVTQRLA